MPISVRLNTAGICQLFNACATWAAAAPDRKIAFVHYSPSEIYSTPCVGIQQLGIGCVALYDLIEAEEINLPALVRKEKLAALESLKYELLQEELEELKKEDQKLESEKES